MRLRRGATGIRVENLHHHGADIIHLGLITAIRSDRVKHFGSNFLSPIFTMDADYVQDSLESELPFGKRDWLWRFSLNDTVRQEKYR